MASHVRPSPVLEATGGVLVLLLLAVLILPPAATSAPAAPPIRVTESNGSGVTFGVDLLRPVWTPLPVAAGDAPRFLVQVEGFETSGQAGAPRLPRSGGWILVPPGHRPELRVLEEDWQDAGGRLLSIEATPIVYRDDEGEVWVGEEMLLPGEEPGAGATVPDAVLRAALQPRPAAGGAAIGLGEVVSWRGRRIVPYTIAPVQADGAGRATRYLQSGRWEVRFRPEPDLKTTAPRAYRDKRSQRGDDRFAFLFLNGDQIMRQPTEAAAGGWRMPAAEDGEVGAPPPTKALLLADEVRLAVERTSLQRVTAQRLIDRGLLPGGLQEDQIRLYQRRYLPELDGSTDPPYLEIEVPIHMVGDGGTFGGDDFFLFYGLRLRDDDAYVADLGEGPVQVPGCGDPHEFNNEFNVYWLAAAEADPGESWARMAVATLPAAAGPLLVSYPRNDHFEERVAFRENVTSLDSDRVYNNDANSSTASMNVQFWSPRQGMDIHLTGAAASFSSSDRILRFTLAGGDFPIELGDRSIGGYTDDQFEFDFPAESVTARNLDLQAFNINSLSRIFAYLNWAEFSYEALFEALGDQLVFNGGNAPVADIEVTGFSSADIGLVEITDPRQPVFVNVGAGNVVADGDEYKLSLRVGQSGGRRSFHAEADMSSDGVVEFHYVKARVAASPSNPADPIGGAPDLIVITHPEFRDALQPWLDHRQARAPEGLQIHTVEVQDLYDWYNGGLKDQWAIKRFVDHAIGAWGSWALMFIGDANENALELGVSSTGRPWATDWVPTHFHIQHISASYQPELLAADKWYAIPSADDDGFPTTTYVPTDMYVGRFPCNSAAELTAMIDKTIVVETALPGQQWRKRGIFMADDAWSSSYTSFDSDLVYHGAEEAFAISQRDSLAYYWRDRVGVSLEAQVLLLDDHLHDFPVDEDNQRDLSDLRVTVETTAMPDLFAHLNDGALIAHYQGHGNTYVLAHEWWIRDRLGSGNRQDLNHLANTNRPFLFFGMGCHLADWAQNTVHQSPEVPKGRSLSEKMIIRSQVGAYATYASSGFEYLSPNRIFSEKMIRRWITNPPSTAVTGEDQKSRWVLGELMWASESDMLPSAGSLGRELVGQYTLLGDPLMVLDCGVPEVDAVLAGTPDQPIAGEVDLVAIDASNQRSITMGSRDESGIDRLLVRDSTGADLSSIVISHESVPDSSNVWLRQQVDYDLTVPIRPFDHVLTLDLFDTADRLETDDHYQLILNLRQTGIFFHDGEEVLEGSFVFEAGVPVDFTAQVTSAAWISDGLALGLEGQNLTISNASVQPAGDHELTLSFTATLEPEAEAKLKDSVNDRGVVLVIDGYRTVYVLESSDVPPPEVSINDVYCYPNPVKDQARFVFQTAAPAGPGRVLIYAVSGRPVADLEFSFVGNGRASIPWNGRDNEGDSMANGVYLYRVVLDTAAGQVASDMQRLVMMQ